MGRDGTAGTIEGMLAIPETQALKTDSPFEYERDFPAEGQIPSSGSIHSLYFSLLFWVTKLEVIC